MMASVELTTDQVRELVRQLPANDKKELLLALAVQSESTRGSRMAQAEQQFRRIAAGRGLDWNTMSEDDRLKLADDLIHEDRSCS
jgi:hypothetical protein